jgi:hypothetical protein
LLVPVAGYARKRTEHTPDSEQLKAMAPVKSVK